MGNENPSNNGAEMYDFDFQAAAQVEKAARRALPNVVARAIPGVRKGAPVVYLIVDNGTIAYHASGKAAVLLTAIETCETFDTLGQALRSNRKVELIVSPAQRTKARR